MYRNISHTILEEYLSLCESYADGGLQTCFEVIKGCLTQKNLTGERKSKQTGSPSQRTILWSVTEILLHV